MNSSDDVVRKCLEELVEGKELPQDILTWLLENEFINCGISEPLGHDSKNYIYTGLAAKGAKILYPDHF